MVKALEDCVLKPILIDHGGDELLMVACGKQ